MRGQINERLSNAVDFSGKHTVPSGQRRPGRLAAGSADKIHDGFGLGKGNFTV